MKTVLQAIAVTSLTMAFHTSGIAQTAAYPTESIRLVIPYTPGGGADTLGRLVASKMPDTLGAQIIIENKPGANTMLATNQVAGASNNGYTLLYASSSFTINPHLYQTNYDPETSFAPIAILSEIPLVMVTSNQSPLQSVADVVTQAKTAPGKLTYGSYGLGSAAHLGGALFEKLSGASLLHVPYKGSAPALNDLMGNHVDLAIVSFEAARELIKSASVRPLGILDAQRLKSFPDIPTVSETVPGAVTSGWNGILAPAGTPASIVQTLNEAANKALHSPELTRYFEAQGMEANPRSPAQFTAIIHEENTKWADIVKSANIKVN